MNSFIKKITLRRFSFLIFTCLCFLGATYQVSQLTSSYLLYNTTRLLEIIPATANEPETLFFCVRYTDLLNFTAIRATGGENNRSEWIRTNDAEGIRRYQKFLKISEIFTFTPETDDVVDYATVRKEKSFEQIDCNASDCYNLFHLNKFVYLEYICYSFRPLFFKKSMSYHSIAVTPSSAGRIFSIRFTELFNHTRIYKICFDKLYGLPYQSLPIATLKKRSIIDEDKSHRKGVDLSDKEAFEQEYNSLVASTSKLSTDLLPRPYDTQCMYYEDKGITSRAQCIQNCMNSSVFNILHKVPFSIIINKSIDEFMVSYLDTLDETVTNALFSSEKSCRLVCHSPDCHSILTFTNVQEEAGHELEINLVLSTTPYTKITAIPSIVFIDFLTAAMSAVSTWTGLAIVSLNPVTLYTVLSRYNWFSKSQVDPIYFKNKRTFYPRRQEVSRVTYNPYFESNPYYFADPWLYKKNNLEVGRLKAKNRLLHQLY